MATALEGLRVIELGSGAAAGIAGMVLAENGAEVVKVEPPSGDPCRGQPGFAVWHRAKKSAVLDLAETGVSDEVLGRLGEMPELRQVFLGGTETSAEGVERFRTDHPRIRITWWEKPPEPERFKNVAP